MPLIWNPTKPTRSIPNEFSIPRHLHYLWGFLGDDGPLPAREQANLEMWQQQNPEWETTVQTPERLGPVLESSPHAEIYQQLPTAIQRCDMARPLLLHEHGGIYSDLDVEPFRDMEWLCGMFSHANVLLIEEVTLTRGSSVRRGNRFAIRNGQPELRFRVGNFWMASVAGHPFWNDVIEMIEERKHLPVKNDYDIIYTTGPDIISEVYHRTRDKYDDVAVVPRRTARRFFRHRTHGSWRTEGRDRQWVA